MKHVVIFIICLLLVKQIHAQSKVQLLLMKDSTTIQTYVMGNYINVSTHYATEVKGNIMFIRADTVFIGFRPIAIQDIIQLHSLLPPRKIKKIDARELLIAAAVGTLATVTGDFFSIPEIANMIINGEEYKLIKKSLQKSKRRNYLVKEPYYISVIDHR